MDLPRKWPGRAKVRQALMILRVGGHWSPDLQRYATSGRGWQKQKYLWFREVYYCDVHGIHPDYERIGR
jgi:hypothetical protein